MLGEFTHPASGEADAQAAIVQIFYNLRLVKSPPPRSSSGGRQDAQHDLLLLVTPDAEAFGEPIVDVPFVRRAAEHLADANVDHAVEAVVNGLIVPIRNLADQ